MKEKITEVEKPLSKLENHLATEERLNKDLLALVKPALFDFLDYVDSLKNTTKEEQAIVGRIELAMAKAQRRIDHGK